MKGKQVRCDCWWSQPLVITFHIWVTKFECTSNLMSCEDGQHIGGSNELTAEEMQYKGVKIILTAYDDDYFTNLC